MKSTADSPRNPENLSERLTLRSSPPQVVQGDGPEPQATGVAPEDDCQKLAAPSGTAPASIAYFNRCLKIFLGK
jgi:hypothetical protein